MKIVNCIKQKFVLELADSVLEVSIRANRQVVGELRGEDGMCEALLEIMAPEINQIVLEKTQKVAQEVTQKVTQKVTQEVTQEVTKEVTREVTQEVTKEVTREVTQKVTQEVTQEVTKDLSRETASKMLKSGKFTVEEIHEYVPKLSIEEIRALEE